MFQGITLLIGLGVLSFLYSSFVMKFISNIVSIETQSMILMFSCILLLLDNFSLFNDLNNENKLDDNEYIKIILNQTIELQKNKLLICKLTNENERQNTVKVSNKKLSKSFSSSFN